MKNYNLALIFGAVALGVAFFGLISLIGFAIAALVIGSEQYKKASVLDKEMKFKIQTGNITPEEYMTFDKKPKTMSLLAMIFGSIALVLHALHLLASVSSAILGAQFIQNWIMFQIFF